MNPPQPKKKPLFSYARYSGIAVQMLVIILAGVFGGRQLDTWLDLAFPVFTLIFSFLSVSIAIYFVIRDLLK